MAYIRGIRNLRGGPGLPDRDWGNISREAQHKPRGGYDTSAGADRALIQRGSSPLHRDSRYTTHPQQVYEPYPPPPPVFGQGGDYTSMLPDPGVEVSGPAPGGSTYSISNPQHSRNQPGLPDPGVQTQTTSQNPQYSGRAAQRQAAKEYVSIPGSVTASAESIPPGIQGLNSFLDGLDNLIASLRIW